MLPSWESGRAKDSSLLKRLPLNYDDTTLRTIEQIDVLWLKHRSIKRAFEVEHTTSIYSGILRMADLLALQPNMDIRLHIVAPEARREKVFAEIKRPVFSLLEKGALSESCTFISYDSVKELVTQPHLTHLSDTVLDDYEEAGRVVRLTGLPMPEVGPQRGNRRASSDPKNETAVDACSICTEPEPLRQALLMTPTEAVGVIDEGSRVEPGPREPRA